MLESGMGYDRKMLDNFKRKLFLKNELKGLILKSIIKNNNIPYFLKYSAYYNKLSLIRYSSIIQKRNRCIKSGRVWNVLKIAKYSRFVFLNESYAGNMPGLKRASW